MTTKRKIIAGFCIMILLLAALAVIGYRSLDTASSNLTSYDRLARLNVNLSDVASGLFESAYNQERYLARFESDRMAAAINKTRGVIALGEQSMQYFIDPERITAANKGLEKMHDYLKAQESVQSNFATYKEEYRKMLAPLKQLHEELGKSVLLAASNNNLRALELMNRIWEATSQLNAAINVAGHSLSLETAKAADQAMLDFKETVDALERATVTPEGRQALAQLLATYQDVSKGFDSFNSYGKRTVTDTETSIRLGGELIVFISQINSAVNQEMDADSKASLAGNANAQSMLLGVSGTGLLVGIAIAVLIIISLVGVLRRLSGFAGAVAKGDFGHDPRIREKGEIGAMVQAMRQIPAIFSEVIGQCNSAANSISRGLFNSRLDESKVSGGFLDLVRNINAVAATYTKILSDLPIMLYTCDKKRVIQYMNETGKKIAGNDAVGKTSFEMLALPLPKNLREDHIPAEDGELLVHPGGKRMIIHYILSPLHDLQGKLAGFIEVESDITQIRDQQETMTQVSSRAAEISDRVAAAAEQLSAQVEQVSRGAEMQRDRVESTASAMTEMNSTVLEVARNAGQASEQSDGTKTNAVAGAEQVNEVVQAIRNVNAIAAALQKNMENLGQQADSIGGVMSVISDIADQTNLLALNAAIEAARAGEAGRGFAVVADEVRKLAEKTMSATQEVSASITAIQQAAETNIQAVRGAVDSVNQATELANTSGLSLEQIVSLATATSGVVASIATAAEEQSATSDEITRAIEEINRVVAETADGMVQAAAAVQDLSRMAQELRQVMDSLR